MPTFYYITSNIKCKLAQLEDRLSDQIKKSQFYAVYKKQFKSNAVNFKS